MTEIPLPTLIDHIKKEFREKKGDQLGKEVSDDEIQNPNSLFRVSLDPTNKDMWIGVRVVLLPDGAIVDDAKWVHREKGVVLEGILRAESMTGEDAYYIYGPADDIGARKKELIRFDYE